MTKVSQGLSSTIVACFCPFGRVLENHKYNLTEESITVQLNPLLNWRYHNIMFQAPTQILGTQQQDNCCNQITSLFFNSSFQTIFI